MRYSTLVTALVFCALSVWTNFSYSQSQICNCLSPGETPTSSPPSDVTICEGDTAVLTISTSGGVSDFPTAYFFQYFGNNALELYRHDYNTNTTDTLTLTPAQMQNIRGGTIKEDTLVALLNNGSVFYFFDNGSSITHDMKWNFPKRPSYTWQGLDFNDADGNFYALASAADTTVLYELDTAAQDTIFIAEYIGGFTWLTSNSNGLLYSLNTATDSVYHMDPSNGVLTEVGYLGLDADGCQGGDFDPTSGKLYATVFDGTLATTGLIDTASGAYCVADTFAMDTSLCPLIILPSDPFDVDSLLVSWTPTDSLSNSDSLTTAAFPSTTTTYSYSVTDDCGNITTDTVRVTVIEHPDPLNSQSCNSSINTSLGANCMDTLTPREILTPNYNSQCVNQFFEVIIPGRTEPILGPDDVGETITVTVQPDGGGNYCWSDVFVEDKMPPMIECEDDTVDFGDPIPAPMVTDNCGDFERFDTLDIRFFTPSPCDTNFLYGVRDSLAAVDSSGNADTCARTVLVRRPEVDDIVFPDSMSIVTNNPIHCSTNFPTAPNSPYPDPSFSGEPETTDGTDINDLPDAYNIDAYYQDIPLSSVNTCTTKVLRMWHVVTWVCGDLDTVGSNPQLLEIVDTTGPQMTCPTFNTISTNGNNCSASVTIPYPYPQEDCNNIERVTVNYPGNFIDSLEEGGATIELPVDTNTITYTAYNTCGDTAQCSFEIIVEDNNKPTIISKSPNVGLNPTGPTRVYASSFDDGSYDDCALDYLEVARMDAACGYGTSFGPYVEFSCCDVGGPITIILRGYDEAGNFNDVMETIVVQDKTDAEIVAPNDITVSCQYPIDTSNLDEFGTVVPTDNPNALNNPFLEPDVDSIILNDPGQNGVDSFYGYDGVAFDDCTYTIQESKQVQELSCNRQVITRTFTVFQSGIPQASDQQVITVENPGGFLRSDITFPKDTMIVGSCGGASIHPDSLGPVHGKPSVDPTACSSIMVNKKDELYYSLTTGDTVCYKVLRTWRVLDWCTTDSRGNPIVYEDVQLIKVVNTVGPAFVPSPDTLTQCSVTPNCGPDFISLSQEATDDCTPQSELIWRYQIDEFNDGSIDDYGNSSDASNIYPIGFHRIIWTVEDECGNETDRIQYFEIEACKAPTPKLLSGIILELTPMDTSGDDTSDIAMNWISAQQLDAGSFHACGYDIQLSFDSLNLNDTLRVFDCSDGVGVKELTVYVTDENGRQDSARTYVVIQDNTKFCSNDPGPIHPITGNITSTAGAKLPSTEVILGGDANIMTMTDDDGAYSFPPMSEGGTYTITPHKDTDVLNGISTFDILLIQQFVLGMRDFNDPLLHVAADIDNNAKITGSDIIELRKLILGINQEFEHNTSWRFVDANFNFNNGDPLTQSFPESYYIPNLNGKMQIDFNALKVGDVNNSAQYDGTGADTRFAQTEYLHLLDRKIPSGATVEIPVYADETIETMYGIQADWVYNAHLLRLRNVKSGQLTLDAQQMKLYESGVRMSITYPNGKELKENEPLFYFVVTSKHPTYVNSVLNLNPKYLHAEIYTDNGEADLKISFRSSIQEQATFELFQNQPNPFSDATIVKFSLPENLRAELEITDISGKRVFKLERECNKGWNEISLRKSDIGAPGIYYYQLKAGNFRASKKMILVD